MSTVGFSGHETFPFRYGWLTKGINMVDERPNLFSSDDAMATLGVGKNMVNSIRHWCSTARLIEHSAEHGHLNAYQVTTELGRLLLGEKGWDPYLEDPATLWIIHWKIATNLSQATTWYWLFNKWHSVEFSKEEVSREIQRWIENEDQKSVSENTLSRDIDCFIRTYVHSRNNKNFVSEDSFDCPLVELGLISEIEDHRRYQFQRGDKVSLPDEVFIFALSEFWTKFASNAKSLSIERIIYDPESPGKIFKLDEESVAKRLDDIGKNTGGSFDYRETAGIKQVYKIREVSPLTWLEKYYGKGIS